MHESLYLQNDQDESLRLWIEGYQFPETMDNRTANWLDVGIEVYLKQGPWSEISPCMFTADIPKFVDWLTAVGAGRNQRDGFGLSEPELQFGLMGQFPCPLRFYFYCDFEPDWNESGDDVYFEILLDQVTLLTIIDAFENMLVDFPTRFRE